MEETDYSEECKFDIFESIEKNKENYKWIVSTISQTAPDYEVVAEKIKKKGIVLTKKQFNKACKDLGLKS